MCRLNSRQTRRRLTFRIFSYFLFTPLLPSVTVGTLSARSILEPTRFLTRHLKRKTEVYEGEVYEVDPEKKTVRFVGESFLLSSRCRSLLNELDSRRQLGDQGRG